LALVWHLKHWLSSYAWLIKGLPGIKTRQKAMARPITLEYFMPETTYSIFKKAKSVNFLMQITKIL